MKKYLLYCLLFVLHFNTSAQLANWTPGGSTDFPSATFSGRAAGYCRITQLKFHPTDSNKMYAVTPNGGLFASTDGGENWSVKPGTDNYTGSNASVCIDRTNDQILYSGTGCSDYYSNGDGVFKSTDGGLSFSPTSLSNCLVIEILQSPTADSVLVAATNKGIYKSTNKGLTWTATTATNIQFVDLKQNTAPNSQILYATTLENAARFFRSTDFGSTWTVITSGITAGVNYTQTGARIAVTPANPNVVYFSVISGLGIIHLSTDGGLNFTVRKAEGVPNLPGYDSTVTGGGQGNYNNGITVDRLNPGKLWYLSHCVWTSNDSGKTWIFLLPWANDQMHTDLKQIQQSPYNPNKLFASNDGGLCLSLDGGHTWTPKCNGIYASDITADGGNGSHTDKDYVMIGGMDNGKRYRNATGWVTIAPGDDGSYKAFDYQPNGGYCYILGYDQRLSPPTSPKGNIGWGSYAAPTTSIYAHICFNRKAPNLAFTGDTAIYRTGNLSAAIPSWTQMASFGTQTIMALHNCIADTNILYVITNDGKIHVSTNACSAAPAFIQYTLPSASNSVASIAAIANNAHTVYISINNKVYVSTNTGATWTDITYNLPNVNHKRIMAEEFGGTQELVFIATNNAVYHKKAGQTLWINYSTNLPGRKNPNDFSMYDDGTNQAVIRYATWGRGIWQTPFDNLRVFSEQILVNNKSILDSTTIPIITCVNPTIQFADGSVGENNGPYSYSWSFPGGTPSSSNAANPNVVYPASGYYTVSLTITDASNVSATQTATRYIQVVPCAADTVPGSAISIAGTPNYGTIPAVNLGTTNNVTLSTWVKISGTQPSFAGIISSPAGGACGLNFRSNNQIGYTWNNLASTYNYAGGPTIPANTWTHLALVITPTNATIYVNGVPYTNNVANDTTTFTSTWNLGNDRDWASRTITGLMDEVCFYNRSLSQTEVRELMNLTKNHTAVDAGLKAYYQCNEVGSTVYDRAGQNNATLLGTATHVVSTAPVGGGVAQTLTVTGGGTANFTAPGVALTFPASGTYPNGDLVVTRLNVPSDQPASAYTLPHAPVSYYVIRNYGTNSSFTSLTAMTFSNVQGTTADMVAAPSNLQLYKRGSNDDGATWGSAINNAAIVTNNSGTGTVAFTTGLNNTSFSQFSIGTSSVPLPLQLLLFEANSPDNKTVTLNWKMSQEQGLSQYGIERSSDAVHFSNIGLQNALGTLTYSYIDEHPFSGDNYYRLRLQGIAGTSTYSPVRKVNLSLNASMQLYPNPSKDGIISYSLKGITSGLELELRVVDESGKVVRTVSQMNVKNSVAYSLFIGTPGVYYVHIHLSDGQDFSSPVLILK